MGKCNLCNANKLKTIYWSKKYFREHNKIKKVFERLDKNIHLVKNKTINGKKYYRVQMSLEKYEKIKKKIIAGKRS